MKAEAHVYLCLLTFPAGLAAGCRGRQKLQVWARPPAGPSASKCQIERRSLTPKGDCRDPIVQAGSGYFSKQTGPSTVSEGMVPRSPALATHPGRVPNGHPKGWHLESRATTKNFIKCALIAWCLSPASFFMSVPSGVYQVMFLERLSIPGVWAKLRVPALLLGKPPEKLL